MEQPIRYWVPSIAPSGMAFYTGDLLPAWRGNLFVGALAAQLLVRLELDGDKVVKEERLLRDVRERIRDVRQGPDGALWLVTDSGSGRILRVDAGEVTPVAVERAAQVHVSPAVLSSPGSVAQAQQRQNMPSMHADVIVPTRSFSIRRLRSDKQELRGRTA